MTVERVMLSSFRLDVRVWNTAWSGSTACASWMSSRQNATASVLQVDAADPDEADGEAYLVYAPVLLQYRTPLPSSPPPRACASPHSMGTRAESPNSTSPPSCSCSASTILLRGLAK